jgi:hypothetical protein
MTGGGDSGAPNVVVQLPLTGSVAACCPAATSVTAGAPRDLDAEPVSGVGADGPEHAVVVMVASNTNAAAILEWVSCMGDLLIDVPMMQIPAAVSHG